MSIRFRRGTPGTQFRPTRRSRRAALHCRAPSGCDQYQQRTAGHDRGLPFGRSVVNVNRRLTHVPAEPAMTRAQWIRGNAARYFAYFQRKPRFAAGATWRQSLRLGVGTVVFAAIIAATMTFVDARAVAVAQRVPERLIGFFSYVTDFGKSFWFLVP